MNIVEYKNESTILTSYGINARKQNEQCNKGNKKESDTQGKNSKTEKKREPVYRKSNWVGTTLLV